MILIGIFITGAGGVVFGGSFHDLIHLQKRKFKSICGIVSGVVALIYGQHLMSPLVDFVLGH